MARNRKEESILDSREKLAEDSPGLVEALSEFLGELKEYRRAVAQRPGSSGAPSQSKFKASSGSGRWPSSRP
jgi:hypothetical protein